MFDNNSPQTPPNRGPPLSSSTPMLTPVNPMPKVSAKTCLPRPLFHEPETFSTKKEKREGGLFRPPPKPPAKSCPPKSRVFMHNRNLLKTQAISFNDTADKDAVATETPLKSSVYDDKKGESYFEQAFIVEKKIGAGYFGELMTDLG